MRQGMNIGKDNLKAGRYRAYNDDFDFFNNYEIFIDAKETEKSFLFDLVSFESRYSAYHIKRMFEDHNRVKIDKRGSKHAMRIWSDHDFTIYPFQAGIPFHFKLCETHLED